MTTKIDIFNKLQLKKGLPDIRPGDTIRVYQKIREKKDQDSPSAKQEKAQTFEGLVIARKHGKGISATITVRKAISGIGVEKIIPLHSPLVEKIEILKRGKARRAKLYYLREAKGRKAKLKKRENVELSLEEKIEEEIVKNKKNEGESEK